jgi:general secretion pathway protein D
MIDNATDAASAPLQVQFDPKVLRLNGINRGDFFTKDGQQPVFNIMNDTGSAVVQLSRLPGSPAVSGSGTLVTLSFQAVGKGTTTVSIPNFAVRGPQGQPIASGSAALNVNIK